MMTPITPYLLLASCDHGQDENQQVFSRGFYSPLCSPNRVCLYRYPAHKCFRTAEWLSSFFLTWERP